MNKIIILITFFILTNIICTNAQITERERPKGWEKLVFGGRFMDRFLPLPDLNGTSDAIWGAKGVIPRDTNNGIEHKDWSYWGGNIRLMIDGNYHLFVCRWPENAPKGHYEWGNSNVVHAVAKNSFGPYNIIQEIGKGHNPEWYITSTGKYIIYVINGYYSSDNINGPWQYNHFDFDQRDREIIDDLSNLSFIKREDGSYLMVCRGGGIWISKDGVNKWNQVSDKSVYPPVDGRFEDPLIWKTNIQYHLIVNDWLGRFAWHMRSKDGISWKVDAGEAYLPGIARHKNGTIEDWFKFERMKVLQDSFGRATQANFAVIDTLKYMDKSDDNHSSKFITIPLTVGKLIAVLNKEPINEKTKEISILVKSEQNFNAYTDIDLESLRFGAPQVVDFGMGCKVKSISKKGNDAIITFTGSGNGLTNDNFAAKLLGKDKSGNMLFAYSKLPGVRYIEPILSARKPVYSAPENKLLIQIENFGQVASDEATVHIYNIAEKEKNMIGNAIVPPVKPYDDININIEIQNELTWLNKQNYLIVINQNKINEVTFYTNKKHD